MCNDYDLKGLTIPEILEILRAVRSATQHDRTLDGFSNHLLAAINDLTMMRQLAFEQLQESLEEEKNKRHELVRHAPTPELMN